MQLSLNPDGSETVRYNDPSVPFYICPGVLSNFENFSAISHWHDDIELIYIQKGHMWYNVSGHVLLLETGEGIFVNSRQLHYGFSQDYQECEFLSVDIHPSLLASSPYIAQTYVTPLLQSPAMAYCHLRPSVPWQRTLMEHIQEAATLGQEEKSGYRYQLLAMSIWQCLLEALPSAAPGTAVHSPSLSILKDMIRFIQKNYPERVTLEEIAAAGNVSKSQCGILFRQHTGQTPVEYLTEYRLREAARRLQETEDPVLSVALETGFGGSSYFCEVFRRKYGLSPLRFRRQSREAAGMS